MTPTLIPAHPAYLDSEVLDHLARLEGECLTVLLPPHRPGAPEGDRLITLHSLFHTLPHLPDDLRKQAETAVLEHRPTRGGTGLAIFVGRDFRETYEANYVEGRIRLGDHCLLLPFLLEAQAPQDFLILGLGKKHLRWIRYFHGECSPLEIPAGVPESLEEFRNYEARGDINRQGAQSSPGGFAFGTLSEREDEAEHMAHFFARIEHGLYPELGHRLLLLMGLEQEIAIFRRVAKHGHLFSEHIAHGGGDLALGEIAQRACECARSRQRAEGAEALRKFRERRNRKLAISGAAEVLDAAQTGRVHILCIPEADAAAEQAIWNAAAVETFRHGGSVLATDPLAPLAALLRY